MDVLNIKTNDRNELVDITNEVENTVQIDDGLLTVFIPHTTAGVCINENADPSVKRDVLTKLKDLIPKNDDYKHLEGNSDSHIKSILTGSSIQVIIENGKLKLGRWQGIFLCEFDGPRKRNVWIKQIQK